METGAATHVGLVRTRNEDAHHVDPERGIVLVADGLGGHPAGDVASELAVQSIADTLTAIDGNAPEPVLVRSLRRANDIILDDASDHTGRVGMGTTAVVAYLADGGERAWIAHVGDSRAYVLRDGRLAQITNDHTTGGPFGRGQITQALGNRGGVDPDCVGLDVRTGDRLLLCTDGLTDMLTDAEIADIADTERSAQEACDALIEATLERGAIDNVTIVIADVTG